MYLKNIPIKIMNVIRYIFNFGGVFEVIISIWVMVSLLSHYGDDYETIINAKATPECVVGIIGGSIMLFIAYKLKRIVEDANFFSSYFEGDLDGYVTYKDLADVTAKRESRIRRRLKFLRIICMKNFEFQEVNYTEMVVLNSKKYLCQCKSCGAPIEKRIYFTGTCSYCGGSDLFAKVITDNRFYCIDYSISQSEQKPSYYTASNLKIKRFISKFLMAIDVIILLILTIYLFDQNAKYNDKEYLIKVLLSGESYSSFDLIKKEMRDVILMAIAFIIMLLPAVISRGKKIYYIFVANKYSKIFSRYMTPFINAAEVTPNNSSADKMVKAVSGSIRKRYLKNCTIEKHDGVLKVALAKKIVKDQCVFCGASIVGAVDEHYRCNYCNNLIMGVVRKK